MFIIINPNPTDTTNPNNLNPTDTTPNNLKIVLTLAIFPIKSFFVLGLLDAEHPIAASGAEPWQRSKGGRAMAAKCSVAPGRDAGRVSGARVTSGSFVKTGR